jgi:sigma-B regulation protein RsbU (phosphoserine phosphatase)
MLSGLISREIEGGNSPRTILHRINKTLHLKTERNTFTTMLFVSLNVITKTLTFSNAGHLRPIIIRNGVLQHLDTTGMGLPLGIMKDIEYNEAALQLQNNDIVILCSDGITETINEQDEFFELKGLEEVVRSLDYRMSAVEMVQSIIYKVNEFSGNAKQHDDITLVVVKVM